MNTSSYYTLGTLVPPALPCRFPIYTHMNALHTHTGRDREEGEEGGLTSCTNGVLH